MARKGATGGRVVLKEDGTRGFVAGERAHQDIHEENDQLGRFVDHFGRLDRSQRSGHAGRCSLVDHVPREARVLLRRAPRLLPQARSGQQELPRERG